MDSMEDHEHEELKHFINIIYAFMSYKRDGSVDVERIYRSFNLLSGDDKALLVESPASRTIKILKALIKNQEFIIAMISGIVDFETYKGKLDNFYNGNKYTEQDVLSEMRNIIRNTSFCNCPADLDDNEIEPTSDPLVLQRNINWVRSTLRQFVRDWSEEGEKERNQCFIPLLDALTRRVPITDPKNPPLILCPGSGLGRLPFEVLKLGYSSQGNEFSYFMLIGTFDVWVPILSIPLGSHFIINHSIKPKSFKIYPYCLDTSNRISKEDHLKSIKIPDVSPSDFKFDGQNFSICAGEFIEAYDGFSDHFDGVLTSFFLDTAKNIISYIRTIARLTKRGALWANIGPLLYHYADLTHNSIELPWEEVRLIILKWFTIETFDIKEAYYTSNSLSMMKTQYKCIYFEATRNDVEVQGESRNFVILFFTLAVITNAFVANFKYNFNSTSLTPYRTSDREDSVKFGQNNTHQAPNRYRSTHLEARKKYTHVQVTLEKDTPNVGKKGEIVYVTQNYAFNYLVPFGFARYTTRAELVGLTLDRNYKECLQNVRKTSALQLKERLGKDLAVEFEVPYSNTDKSKLNSPLRPIHIIYKLRNMQLLGPLDMLREQDVRIHTESGFIHQFGTHNVTLTLDENIEYLMKVKVKETSVDVIIDNDKLQI